MSALAKKVFRLGFVALCGSLCFFSSLVESAHACPGQLAELSQDLSALLIRSKSVVVGEVTGSREDGAFTQFDVNVVDTLRGSTPQKFVLRLPSMREAAASAGEPIESLLAERGPLADHSDVRFWLGDKTEAIRYACGFTFNLRPGRYLMFLDKPYHKAAFEKISSKNDPWYRVVAVAIRDRKIQGLDIEPVTFIKKFYAVEQHECNSWREWWKGSRRIAGHKLSPNKFVPIFDETVCRRQSDSYLALFTSAADTAPRAIPVVNGMVEFQARYGNFVLRNRRVKLADFH